MAFPKVKTRIIIILSVILLLLVSTMWYSINSIDHLRENLDIQVRTRTIILNLNENLTNLLNAETAERGFVITGTENYLEPYNQSKIEIREARKDLFKLTRQDTNIHSLVDSLDKYIELKLNYIERIIYLKRNGKEKEIKELLTKGEGKYFMDKVREFNKALQESTDLLFSERKNITYASLEESRAIFVKEGILVILITLFLAITIIGELNRRIRSELKLQKNNEELERKNNEIEQFAYISAHDLQEPLRSISNFASLLEERVENTPDPKVKKYLKTIKGASGRMSNLIADLLEYSRLGKDIQKSKIDCNQLVHEVISDLGSIIRETQTKIEIEKLPVVTGQNSLKSLFQNLILNAIKFSRKNEKPHIRISATQNQHEHIFLIQDNGIGIDPAYFDRIFTIFQRLHSREEYPGTGIGLAQCKKIVELHGGKIWVESEPDAGSRFYFSISKFQ